jgi:hypothetical protein
MGVWAYRRPEYAWWLKQLSPAWEDPYWTDLTPAPWTESVGVTPFEITPALYAFTARYYKVQPTVPRERCFDKISFRENLDPDGEFFLLDGYGRGLHLHYDTNAITKFFADGEDWLIDGDYLVRNTTDHCMLSLTRDGRCERQVPAFAEVLALADRPGLAVSLTRAADYMGADWDRAVVWFKGQAVCVRDEIAAREPGLYKAQCVWKMLDQGTLDADTRSFTVTRNPVGEPGRHHVEIVENPADGVAAALRFSDRDSRMDFTVELPAGEYRLNAVAKAADNGTDSFWVAVNNGTPVACHLTLGAFGRSYDSGVNPKSGPMPVVTVEKDGTQVVTVSMRDKPSPLLDRVEFLDAAGTVVAAVEAESAPVPPASLMARAPDRIFTLAGDGASRLSFSRRLNHSRLPLVYAHHKFSGVLAAGERIANTAVFGSRLSGSGEGVPDMRPVSAAVSMLLVSGSPHAVFTTARDALGLPDALRSDARVSVLLRDRLLLCGLTHLGGRTWDRPVTCDIDLGTGEIAVAHIPRIDPADIAGAVPPACPPLSGAVRAAVAARAAELLAQAPSAAAAEVVESARAARAIVPSVTAVPPLMHRGTVQSVLEMIASDVDGDGSQELLALRGRFLSCIDAEGTVLWEFDGTDELYAVCTYDTDGDGKQEVFTGGKSKRLYLLDSDGSLVRDHAIETYWRVSRTTIHEPRLDDVLVRDFDGDGRWEAVLGTVDGFTQVIDDRFAQQWIDGETNHGTTELQPLDWDGDGVLEVSVGNRYGKLRVYRIADGKLIGSLGSELGDVQIAAGDMDGDGRPEVINGSSTGELRCGRSRRDLLWTFPNYGYAVRDILCADLVGDGRPETVITSDTEFVYLLDAGGKELAHTDLGAEPCNVVCVPAPVGGTVQLATGTRSGAVILLDRRLRMIGCASVGSQVNWVAALAGAGGARLAAGLEDGRVVLFDTPGGE